MKEEFKIPIFLLTKNKDLQDHLRSVFNQAGYDVMFFHNVDKTFWDLIRRTAWAIVFIESAILRSYGILLYDEVFRNCPGAKIVLLCSENDRVLIKDAMDKGGYGSILEPYDPWEITTIVKHLTADLLVQRNNLSKNHKLNETIS